MLSTQLAHAFTLIFKTSSGTVSPFKMANVAFVICLQNKQETKKSISFKIILLFSKPHYESRWGLFCSKHNSSRERTLTKCCTSLKSESKQSGYNTWQSLCPNKQQKDPKSKGQFSTKAFSEISPTSAKLADHTTVTCCFGYIMR